MGSDVLVVLIVILIVVLIWRGPKTLPKLGAMFGRGVKAARDEAADIGSSMTKKDDDPKV